MRMTFLTLLVGVAVFFAGCSNGDGDDNNHTAAEFFPVLVEDFSHVDCNPCVAVSNALHAAVEHFAADGKVPVVIEYHPRPAGFADDVFHDASPVVHEERYAAYAVSNLPHLFVNCAAVSYTDRVDQYRLIAIIDSAKSAVMHFEIALDTAIVNDSLVVSATVTADSADSGTVFCYIMRKNIVFTTAPGSNGLVEYHNVAAEKFVNIHGNTISLAAAESRTISDKLPLPTELANATTDGFGVVFFVQRGTQIIGCAVQN